MAAARLKILSITYEHNYFNFTFLNNMPFPEHEIGQAADKINVRTYFHARYPNLLKAFIRQDNIPKLKEFLEQCLKLTAQKKDKNTL